MKQNMQSSAFAGLHILYTEWVVCKCCTQMSMKPCKVWHVTHCCLKQCSFTPHVLLLSSRFTY